MASTPLSAIARDPELRGAPTSVLLLLNEQLSPSEYRPVKCRWVGALLRVRHTTVSRSLQVLARKGYIRRGRRRGRIRTYRLLRPL